MFDNYDIAYMICMITEQCGYCMYAYIKYILEDQYSDHHNNGIISEYCSVRRIKKALETVDHHILLRKLKF